MEGLGADIPDKYRLAQGNASKVSMLTANIVVEGSVLTRQARGTPPSYHCPDSVSALSATPSIALASAEIRWSISGAAPHPSLKIVFS